MGTHATNTLSLAHDKCLLDGSFMTTLIGVKKGRRTCATDSPYAEKLTREQSSVLDS